MQSAAQMTVEEFEKALKEFEEKYLKLHPVFNAELKPRY